MGVTVDQAHRGYTVAQDGAAFASPNPLFWKPTPSDGKFTGQRTYGYLSFEGFIDAVNEVNSGRKRVSDFDGDLPTISTIVGTTAILEAGRKSLDMGGAPFELVYSSDEVHAVPTSMRPAQASVAEVGRWVHTIPRLVGFACDFPNLRLRMCMASIPKTR